MPTTHDERPFERHGKVFSALLNEQDDGRLSVTVRDSASAALAVAEAFAEELVGEC